MEPRARVSVWPGVAAYPVLLPPTLGEHVEQNVSLAMSSGTRFLLRLVCATVLRRATVCAIVTGPAPREHAPPQAVYPRRLMGSGGVVVPRGPSPAAFFEQQLIILARRNPVSAHHSCPKKTHRHREGKKSGVSSEEIRCQLIILARKDAPTLDFPPGLLLAVGQP